MSFEYASVSRDKWPNLSPMHKYVMSHTRTYYSAVSVVSANKFGYLRRRCAEFIVFGIDRFWRRIKSCVYES